MLADGCTGVNNWSPRYLSQQGDGGYGTDFEEEKAYGHLS